MDPVTESNFLNMALTSHEQDPAVRRPLCQRSHTLDDILSMNLSDNLPHTETSSELHLDPVYIAPSAASQIITTDIDRQKDQFKVTILTSLVLVEPLSLALVNQFLDQLLFDLISTSPSLVMCALRSAVIEILKPTLGANALHHADLELKEYLDGIEDYTQPDSQDDIDLADTIDIKSLWKKTRIRCMIYSSLGDLEEEESILNGTYCEADDPSTIPPVTAIFLTSILEFVGEQILIAAGRTALHKLTMERSNLDNQKMKNTDGVECLVVEADVMKRITFDNYLDDLWRAWRSYKEPSVNPVSHPRPVSIDSYNSCLPSSQIVRETRNKSSIYTETLLPIPTSLDYLDLETAKTILGPLSSDGETKHAAFTTKLESKLNQRPWSRLSISSLPERRTDSFSEDSCQIYGAKRRRATTISESQRLPKTNIVEQWKPAAHTEFAHLPLISLAQEITTQVRDDGQKTNQVELRTLNCGQTRTKEEFKDDISNNPTDHCDIVTEMNFAIKKTPELIPNTQTEELTRSVLLESDGNGQTPLEKFNNSTHGQSIDIDTTRNMGEIEHCQEILSINENNKTWSKPNSNQSDSHGLCPSAETQPMNQHANEAIDNDAYSSKSLLSVSQPNINSHKGIKLLPTSQIDISHSFKEAMANDTLDSKKSEIKPLRKMLKTDKAKCSETPSCFATALQGIDIYNLTIDTDRELNKESRNQTSTEVNMWYPDTYFNDLVMEKPSKRESVGNISPISLSNDSTTHKGHVSPVSTVSSMEITPDQENTPGISRKNLAFRDSVFETSSEDTNLNCLPKCSAHIPKSASSYSKHSIQTSDSTSPSHSHKMKVIPKSEEDHVGKFDQLIQSDQTLQYTLTPQNVRVMNVTDPHQVSLMKNGISKSSITSNTISTTPKYVAFQTSPSEILPQETKSVRRFITTPQASFHSASKAQSFDSQPRDARIDRQTSLDDFSSSIRSTGTGFSASRKQDSLQGASFSMKKQPQNKQIPNTQNRSHKRLESAPARIKLQSRDAAPKRSDCMIDLIDFVRSGPQIQNSNMYTSRKPSSLNSTVQSTEVNEVKSPEISRAELRSRQNSLSINSSITSQSALLAHSSKSIKSTSLTKNRSGGTKQVISDRFYPKYSGEEDLDSPQSKKVQNESLTDFVRNSSPTMHHPQDSVAGKTAKINISAPGLMSLLGRGLSNTQLSSKGSNRTVIPPHEIGVQSSRSTNPSSLTSLPLPTKRFAPREATYSNARTNDLAQFLMYNEPPPLTEFNDQRIINPTISSQKKEIGPIHKIFNRRKTKVVSRF